MSNGVKGFTEVEGNDEDKVVGGEKVGDSVQNSNEAQMH